MRSSIDANRAAELRKQADRYERAVGGTNDDPSSETYISQARYDHYMQMAINCRAEARRIEQALLDEES